MAKTRGIVQQVKQTGLRRRQANRQKACTGLGATVGWGMQIITMRTCRFPPVRMAITKETKTTGAGKGNPSWHSAVRDAHEYNHYAQRMEAPRKIRSLFTVALFRAENGSNLSAWPLMNTQACAACLHTGLFFQSFKRVNSHIGNEMGRAGDHCS